jgi:hypothetical protein
MRRIFVILCKSITSFYYGLPIRGDWTGSLKSEREANCLSWLCSGGLGLTGGIADVGNLFDALVGIHENLADDSILDKYSEVRMRIWRDIIDPMSRENFRRLWDQDPEKALENDQFFRICKESETNEALARELALVSFFSLFWGTLT